MKLIPLGSHTQDSLRDWSLVSFLAGIGLLALCSLGWFAMRDVGFLLIGAAMLFGGIANALAFLVLGRMESAGHTVGFWRTPNDFRVYSEYWRIAPSRGWSRLPIVGFVAAFIVAACFMFSIPLSGTPLWR